MNTKTATIIGATGLIGGHLLELLLNDTAYTKINVLVRRPIEYNNPKINVVVLDFTNKDAFRSAISGSEVVFCAVGTTTKKVKGDKNAYRKIDYDIPVNAAQFGVETGCQKFVHVSSVGALSTSSSFYLKLKGEVEEKLRSLNIPTLLIFRPSLLLGNRKEFRLGEKLGALSIRKFAMFLPSKIRPIKAFDVAKSMVKASKLNLRGAHLFHYKEMKEIMTN